MESHHMNAPPPGSVSRPRDGAVMYRIKAGNPEGLPAHLRRGFLLRLRYAVTGAVAVRRSGGGVGELGGAGWQKRRDVQGASWPRKAS